MVKNSWDEAGEQIRKLVQDAVDNQNYSQLGSTIANVVNDTVNGLQSSLKENLSGASRAGQSASAGGAQQAAQGSAQKTAPGDAQRAASGGAQRTASGSAQQAAAGDAQRASYDYTNRAAAEQIRRNIQEKHRQQAQQQGKPAAQQKQSAVQAQRRQPATKVKRSVPGEFTARAMKWFGYGMSGIFGLALAILAVVMITTGAPLILPIAILAVMFGLNYSIGSRGSERVGLTQRFRRYSDLIGDRTSCRIEELAAGTGKSAKFVRKDLQRMVEQGLFREGYLDSAKEVFMTNYAVYQQYLSTQAGSETAKQRQKEDTAREKRDEQGLTPECRELIEEGKQYIRHVHECNDRIDDPEMSAKLDRLELVITRIFREVGRNPAIAGDLKKMMSYYLPTTQKLLDAYCEMSAQPIRGQNIEKTQKEIENALDTINTAFENLLDSFFEDKAWDISSDITVLNTMLAQEGLTGKDFERKQGGNEK